MPSTRTSEVQSAWHQGIDICDEVADLAVGVETQRIENNNPITRSDQDILNAPIPWSNYLENPY